MWHVRSEDSAVGAGGAGELMLRERPVLGQMLCFVEVHFARWVHVVH